MKRSPLYGYNLLKGVEVQLTNTPQNETHPSLNGKWVVYEDDSVGDLNSNVALLHLSNFASIQLTATKTPKTRVNRTSGNLLWVNEQSAQQQIMRVALPDFQPVFQNQNMVAITEGVTSFQSDAYSLLLEMNQAVSAWTP